jgi:excisionase family DNA binding protein
VTGEAKTGKAPTFYTVAEAAKVLRCNSSTLYRAIREDAFPAVKIRTRYVVPAAAIERMVQEAEESGACVDVAKLAAERRTEREVARVTGGRY